MKKKYILLTAFIGVMLSACSDFLDRKPLTEPNMKNTYVAVLRWKITLTACIWRFLLLLNMVWE